jgi:isoquinoline 1-oxidoreductase beta subunit
MDSIEPIDRRKFLQRSAGAGSALLLGFYLPGAVLAARDEGAAAPSFKPNAFIRIDGDNVVTVIVGRSEMGQGVLTSLPQIVAEELDADWSKVRWEQSPAHPDYNRPGTPMMITGGSWSVRSSWETLRKAGATARAMLVAAAADIWKIDASTLRTDNSMVIGPGKRRLSYGQLAAKAAGMPVPKAVPLQDPRDFKLVGKSVKRLDTPLKVDGSALFGIDVNLLGMLTAVAIRDLPSGRRSRGSTPSGRGQHRASRQWCRLRAELRWWPTPTGMRARRPSCSKSNGAKARWSGTRRTTSRLRWSWPRNWRAFLRARKVT